MSKEVTSLHFELQSNHKSWHTSFLFLHSSAIWGQERWHKVCKFATKSCPATQLCVCKILHCVKHSNGKILHLANYFTQPAVVMIVTNMMCESWLLFLKKNWHIDEFWHSWLSNKAQLIYPSFFQPLNRFPEEMINYSQSSRLYLI